MTDRINLDSLDLAKRIRAHSLRMVHRANASHIGGNLSIADILAVLYTGILKFDSKAPDAPDRDRLIISKGHAAAVVYSVLAEIGFFPVELLDDFCRNGSTLCGHISHKGNPGVEVSTGSLGHGLSIGCGMAMAARTAELPYRVFVIMSDGECGEGAVWEAAAFAKHYKLGNLVSIVDANGLQGMGRTSEVLDLSPLADHWRGFGWRIETVDGHDHLALSSALNSIDRNSLKPTAIIANTVKGKGVSFLEGRLEWHYKSPNEDELRRALKEIGA